MTRESSFARKALALAAVPVAVFIAVPVQLTVVNRLPLPGAAAPDLVLLLVTAVAVCTTPLAAAVTGFASGLALDVAPPSAHYAGEYALIFCLAAWGAARVKASAEHATGEWDTPAALGVMAAALAAGEAGKAVLGLLLSNPDVTVPAIQHVLPVALVYDLILAPLVLWPVALIARGPAAERAPRPRFSHGQRFASVFRLASAGGVPDLRLAGTGQKYKPAATPRRVPKLRLADARSSAAARTVAAYSAGAPFPLAGGRAATLHFASQRRAGAAGRPRQPRTPGKHWLRTADKNWPAASAALSARPALRPSRSLGKGWLRSSSSPSLARSRPLGNVVVAGSKGMSGSRAFSRTTRRTARPLFPRGPRSAKSPVFRRGSVSSGGMALSGNKGLSGATVLSARSAPSGLSALPNLTAGRAARRRPPNAGWLRSSPQYGVAGQRPLARPRRLQPGRRWLRGARRPGSSFPGGRPPVPPGARPMAKGAIVSGARSFGFRLGRPPGARRSGLFRRKGWRW